MALGERGADASVSHRQASGADECEGFRVPDLGLKIRGRCFPVLALVPLWDASNKHPLHHAWVQFGPDGGVFWNGGPPPIQEILALKVEVPEDRGTGI